MKPADFENRTSVTLSEAAQIAKAYCECVKYVGWIAGEMAEKDAVRELVAWHLLFDRWKHGA